MIGEMEEAILKTLAYHDIFDFPLTVEEIWRFLISQSKVNKAELINKLRMMEADKKQIETDGVFYFLWGRKRIVELRKRRERESQKKLRIAEKIAVILGRVPTVEMIGLTGNVVVGNAEKDDDIDILVITSTGKLWLTRALLILILEILGIRRRPQARNYTNKICLNILMDEAHLRIPPEKQNLFTAHELVQTKVIFERDESYRKLLEANKWTERHLPNFKTQDVIGNRQQVIGNRRDNNSRGNRSSVLDFSLLILEKTFYNLQLFYMRPKVSREKIGLNRAFFHPRDLSGWVLREYTKKLKDLGLVYSSN